MPATSPYQNNDYQAVSTFRPFQLPINDIFKAISAQNQFWDEGAARVKNVYDNALNLKLSLEPNKQIRDQYMQDAEKQLTKLSSMDLSDPNVQRQGFNIFKPLFKDEGIVSDDAATRRIDKINADALSFRSKDNGKYYNYYNHKYALFGSKEFKNSQDRMAGKKYLEIAKDYEPYYDYTDDMSKALKDCPASTLVRQSPFYGSDPANQQMTGYSNYTSIKTLSAQQAFACIGAGMPPAGLRQLQIEGAVSYQDNKPTLARDTASYLGDINKNSSTQLQELSAKRTAISDPKNPLGLKDDEKETVLKEIDSRIATISSDINKNTGIITKLNNNDFSPIDDNYDEYAGSIYTQRKLLKRALAASYTDDEKKFIDDPVQMAQQNYINNLHLKEVEHNYAMDLETLKASYDLMKPGSGGKSNGSPIIRDPRTGQITIDPNLEWQHLDLTGQPTPDDKAYSNIQQQVADLNVADSKNNIKLYNEIITRGEKDPKFRSDLLGGFNYENSDAGWQKFKNNSKNNSFGVGADNKPGGIHETAWFNAYFPLNKEDPTFNEWANETTNIQVGLKTLNRHIELAEKEVLRNLGTDATSVEKLKNENLKGIKPINIGGNIITPQMIQDANEGKISPVQIKQGRYFSTGVPGAAGISTGGYETDYYLNGVKLQGSDDATLRNYTNSIKNKNQEITNKLNEERAKVYSNLGFNRDRFALTFDDSSNFVKGIKAAFPENDKPNEKISIQASDFSGAIKINHPGVKAGDANESIVKTYRNILGAGTKIEFPSDGVVLIRGTNYNVIPQAINNPVMKNIAFILNTDAETTAFRNTQPGSIVPGSQMSIPIWRSGKREEATIETYNTGNGPEYRLYLKGATNPEPKVRATNSYDFIQKLSMLPFEFKEPIK